MLSGSARRTDNKERGMEWTFGNLLWSMLAIVVLPFLGT